MQESVTLASGSDTLNERRSVLATRPDALAMSVAVGAADVMTTHDSSVAKPRGIATFWQRVEITQEGCWLWRGTILESGYGQVRVGGKGYLTHRVAWMLKCGAI